MGGKLFRCTPRDVLPALCGVAHLAFLLWAVTAFLELPAWAVVACCFALAAAHCWNLHGIAATFVHNPFFAGAWLNRAFALLETLATGVPLSLFRIQLLNHHAGGCDARGADGTTRDWSSIYRRGKGGAPEPLWRYCLLSLIRVDAGATVRACLRQGRSNVVQAAIETMALGGFWLFLALGNWRVFTFFYLPSYLLGRSLSRAQHYLEHRGATPGNPFANAISSTGRLYNRLWFNRGYHQARHWDPECHWTRLPQLHGRLAPVLRANGARVLRGSHLAAPLKDFFTRRRRRSGEKGVAA
jgi:fatty acid desaturase